MIFKSITLHNLFCYYGSRTFDLSPPTDNQANIVVIMGRNGYGKTSFLNGVKLLFGGVTKELRENVRGDKAPHEKSYVIGDQDWWGILNHKAKVKGDFDCFVSATLLDEQNNEIVIKRSWNLNNGYYQNQLTVIAPRRAPLTNDVAQQYLSELLPKDYIPFFFFDAEDIGYLAEANRNQVIERMEQLLNIRPVDNLKECIKGLTNKIEHDYISDDAELDLIKAENRQKEMGTQREKFQSRNLAIDSDIESLEDELRGIKHKIQLLSGQGAIENNAKLEAERKNELRQKEEALIGLSEAFGRDAFLSLNSKLIEKTIPIADHCATGQQGATTEMLESLREPLKEIFTTPPYPIERLKDSQIRFYQNRVSKLLDSRDIDEDEDYIFRLDSLRAKNLMNLLVAYTPQHRPEKSLCEDLSRALNADTAINNIDKTLQDVSQLSEENKQQLLQFQDEKAQIIDEREKRNDDKRDIEYKLSIIERDLKPLDEKITNFRKLARLSEQGNVRIVLLDKMQKLLAAYKQKLKERQRGKLEEYFNAHLQKLLDSNRLIAKAQIDEFFQLHYLDEKDDPVAMSSLSAGMKQLSATALLWALKDACGKQLPVIIDTPLGRIDKKHQENLLTRYYPQAARQVILLPTDSELDDRKLDLLKPYIYREYHLSNEEGENTEIKLVTSNREVNHG